MPESTHSLKRSWAVYKLYIYRIIEFSSIPYLVWCIVSDCIISPCNAVGNAESTSSRKDACSFTLENAKEQEVTETTFEKNQVVAKNGRYFKSVETRSGSKTAPRASYCLHHENIIIICSNRVRHGYLNAPGDLQYCMRSSVFSVKGQFAATD